MCKIIHDKRPFYNPRKEKIVDPEWDAAEGSDEAPTYYYCYTKTQNGKPHPQSPRFIRVYKPSVAELVRNRTGWYLEEIKGEINGRK